MLISPPTGSLENLETEFAFSVQVDLEGAYSLELSCEDFCGEVSTQIVNLVASDSDLALVPVNTQGACIADLNPQTKYGVNMTGILIFLTFVFTLFIFRFFNSRAWLFALALSFAWSPLLQADTSFSVNTFGPTVDDSDFFTVYDSPTMLKRNYHVGFFLDYANKPYEFGNADFDRVSGVVDHLLTGNIVGSYGIMDWFTAGVVIPVHFYQGINSPLLGLDENNIAIGDIQLTMKFRLLKRLRHQKNKIGLAVVPFITLPTSTNSTDFLGNDSFSGGAKLVLDAKVGRRVAVALNVGYRIRDRVFDVGNNDLDDQFLASLGLSVDLLKNPISNPNKLKAIAEVDAATVTRDFFDARRTTPAEARLGMRYTWRRNHDINAGVGFGIGNGIGNPKYRGFLAYTYTKRPIVDEPPEPIDELLLKEGDELTLNDKIYFEFDRANIREISKPTLDKIAGFLKANPYITKIRIDGYTCDLGSNAYNQRLSDRRSRSVAEYLKGQQLDPSRLGGVTGHGETNFLVPNTDEPSREQNRRVQIFVESVDYSLR